LCEGCVRAHSDTRCNFLHAYFLKLFKKSEKMDRESETKRSDILVCSSRCFPILASFGRNVANMYR
jgi:hypothetical protein